MDYRSILYFTDISPVFYYPPLGNPIVYLQKKDEYEVMFREIVERFRKTGDLSVIWEEADGLKAYEKCERLFRDIVSERAYKYFFPN